MNKDEMKMIEEMAEIMSGCVNCCSYYEHHKHCDSFINSQVFATKLYNAGCRKIADDEIVIKKTDYVELNKDFYDWKKEYDHNCLLRLEVFELEKQLEQAKQETARDILQIIKDEYEYIECIGDLERIIAKKYCIKLE